MHPEHDRLDAGAGSALYGWLHQRLVNEHRRSNGVPPPAFNNIARRSGTSNGPNVATVGRSC